ncbi:hypothetical protein RCS94_01370 [Orbaceae bacterium ac157xtp]
MALTFELLQSEVTPYFELTQSVDLTQVKNKAEDNLFTHNLSLTDELLRWMLEIKQKYN